MSIRESYDRWAELYDTNENRTRDLEAVALRETLQEVPFSGCLEIGCGTGKNTEWLMTRTSHVTAVDFSEGMLEKARKKIRHPEVEFIRADIREPWTFARRSYGMITFSLVLEHVEDLGEIFRKASSALADNGYIYVGELHPARQYGGTKARFETHQGTETLTCFTHHLSDFTGAAGAVGLNVVAIHEYFDNDDRNGIPRILGLLFQKIRPIE
ncbi:MAG TPA: class I SAM-dependent methyltransferase [Bacteroidales bacterium]|nr:class I SAM-dependent methyltransferase [Bacteroidales bacterium]HPS63800.1 class I SAM-dependent methyltransferase [Bacteroidales bacterium]